MIGYPYSYGDSLSGEKAMERRVELFDKGVVLVVCWSLSAAVSHAQGFPANKPDIPDQCAAADAPSPGPMFAPVAGLCACTSPEVKTAILLAGIGAICYSAMCSKDKPLIAACSALATYAATNVSK